MSYCSQSLIYRNMRLIYFLVGLFSFAWVPQQDRGRRKMNRANGDIMSLDLILPKRKSFDVGILCHYCGFSSRPHDICYSCIKQIRPIVLLVDRVKIYNKFHADTNFPYCPICGDGKMYVLMDLCVCHGCTNDISNDKYRVWVARLVFGADIKGVIAGLI